MIKLTFKIFKQYNYWMFGTSEWHLYFNGSVLDNDTISNCMNRKKERRMLKRLENWGGCKHYED